MSKKKATQERQVEVQPDNTEPVIDESATTEEVVEDHSQPNSETEEDTNAAPEVDEEAKNDESSTEPPIDETLTQEPEDTDQDKEDNDEGKPLFVSDNGVLPHTISNNQQFVVGLSQKLPIGTKIKSGTKTFVVDWASDAHRSTLDQRRNAYQTLLRLQTTSHKALESSEYFAEKAEFEIV